MKKQFFQKKLMVAGMFVMVILAGCAKQVDTQPARAGGEESELLQNEAAVADASSIPNLLNASFIAQVNTTTRTDSSTMIFDIVLLKRSQKIGKHCIAVPYGDPQFADRGWKYEITIDPLTQAVLLKPNDIMMGAIVPGSFQTVSAAFDRAAQIFNFVTRFKEPNGNRNEVGETLSKR